MQDEIGVAGVLYERLGVVERRLHVAEIRRGTRDTVIANKTDQIMIVPCQPRADLLAEESGSAENQNFHAGASCIR